MKSNPLVRRAASAMAVWSCIACASLAADTKINASNSKFMPAVTDGSALALGVNFSRPQLFRVADNIVGRIVKMPGVDKQAIDEVRRKVEAYKRDPLTDAPQDVLGFLEECGLRNAFPRWGVLSMEGPVQIGNDSLNLGRTTLAIAIDVDLGKLISAARKKLAENGNTAISFREIPLAGEKVWRIVPDDNDLAEGMRAANADPHLASLDGKLLLVAMSRHAMAKQINLYRKGKGKGDALCGFSAADGELLRFQVSGVGDMIREAAPLDATRDTLPGGIEEIASIGEEVVTGLQTLSYDVKVSQDGTIGQAMRLEAATEDDAELIRTLAGAVIVVAKTFASRSPDVPKDVVGALKGLHVGGLENNIEVRCDDVMPGFVGALFPAISSAKDAGSLSACGMRGRNLFVAITAANIEREALGLGSVWPKTRPEEGADTAKDPLSGAVNSAADYFSLLFDVAKMKDPAQWKPYVSGVDLSVLGGEGMPTVPGGATKIDGTNCLWCVAANVTDETPDCIPVLISANFNPELLLSKWDGHSNRSERLPIGPAHGAAKSLFGDKAIVVVRKGGSVACIKEKDLTYETLYCGQPFDLPAAEPPLVYLTPNGIAKPAAR